MLRCFLPLLLLGLGSIAWAQDYSWLDNPQLEIQRAAVDHQTGVLYIEGEHFGSKRLPTATLDNKPLTVRTPPRPPLRRDRCLPLSALAVTPCAWWLVTIVRDSTSSA